MKEQLVVQLLRDSSEFLRWAEDAARRGRMVEARYWSGQSKRLVEQAYDLQTRPF